jgi:hypothetical protein
MLDLAKLPSIWKSDKNRSVATISKSKLNELLTTWAPGSPLSSQDLLKRGISADLAVHYARAGWLVRLAHGVYARPGDPLALHPCLRFLESKIPGLHVGGKTALDWYGTRHFISQRPATKLYGWNAAKLPDWFIKNFPAEYHRKRLFKEEPGALVHAGPFENQPDAPRVSEPERALLEMLSDVGVRQPLQEARELTQITRTLRSDVLRELLRLCASVKTVRLCLQLGKEFGLPWVAKLNPAELPLGSARPWVSQSSEGLLVIKR